MMRMIRKTSHPQGLSNPATDNIRVSDYTNVDLDAQATNSEVTAILVPVTCSKFE